MIKRVIVLSNSVGRNFKQQVKVTAVREYEGYEVVSLLTSDQCNYRELVKKISLYTSDLFVDLEKKQPLNIQNKVDQLGNLFKSISIAINSLGIENSLNIYPIKLNDITVSATWKLLAKEYKEISGLKIGLIGTGNIGSKLISVLTESGVKVRCFNRDINKAISIVNSVILTKPEHVISSPDVVRRIEHTMIDTNGLILSCSNFKQDISDFIHLMNKDFKIYLIGHSLLMKDSLKNFRENNIDIKRIDVGKELLSFVIGTLMTQRYSVYGNTLFKGQKVCSGGYLGNSGTLIVDDFKSPKWHYSNCDSMGGSTFEKNEKFDNLKKFDDLFN